ncbi:melanocyte-stimulating hormone receptor-like [Stylophora pistillata]|uniref:melanocyte-stimulating hormone receptor-like n=1 Tax=Stylophora pistillata TaxID=50429 RepID=UPI000C057C9C|nr:melanocyte-stimulating hormone receptor-like [Stylophora pistillata]
MATEFCVQKVEEYRKLIRHNGTFMLTFCILNVLFPLVAVLGNLLVIRALWKSSSIPANLKKLFLSLAVSDVAVGLMAQLMFGVINAIMLKMAEDENYDFSFLCPTISNVRHSWLFFLVCASFLTTSSIAVDRLLAICLHLRYQELITSKRLVLALVLFWLASAVMAFIFVVLPDKNTLVSIVVGFVGISVTTAAYIRIYRVVMYHRAQLQALGSRPELNSVTFLREAKSAINTLYVYIVCLVCYFPYACTLTILTTDNLKTSFALANHVSFFLMLLNSSLNPFVYCWRYREIRKHVTRMVRKVLCFAATEP